MSAEELADAYLRPGLPPICLGKMGACIIKSCEGLATVSVTERVATRTGSDLNQASGEFCPTYQVATADGRVYQKTVG